MDLKGVLAKRGWRSVIVRALGLGCAWWIISEGDRGALIIGLPVVLVALSVSLLIPAPPPLRWSAPGLVRYGFAFLVGSLQGGVEVARRALSPALPLAPSIIRYGLRLRTEPARHLFMGTLNLLPGTLGISIAGDELSVHVLVDKGDALILQLQELEAHVARAAGEQVERAHA